MNAFSVTNAADLRSVRSDLEAAKSDIARGLDRIARLEALLHSPADAVSLNIPLAWRLSPVRRRLICALAGARVVHTDILASALYSVRPDGPDDELNVIRSLISKMRSQLAPFGVTIISHRSAGYEIDAKTRAMLNGRAG